MNKRIRELAEQAKPIDEKDQRVRGLNSEYHDQCMEKFAELLIRECANIAYEYDAPKMSGPGMIIAGRIETHFGVEE